MYMPAAVNMSRNSYDILNTIRENASVNFQDYTMEVSDIDSLHRFGNVVMDNESVANEFCNALLNRIFKTIITSRMYENPLRFMKKGILELGERVQEIFVNLCDPVNYDGNAGATEIFKKYQNDVRQAFHPLNFRKMYPVSVSREQLQTAFITETGLTSFIDKLVEQCYKSSEYDEYCCMIYLIAKNILNGRLYSETITSDVHETVTTMKSVSNKAEFLRTGKDYNVAGVYNFSLKDDQFLISTSDFDANNDVNVLASAFNMDKAEFLGHRVTVDSFVPDGARLAKIFEGESGYTPLTSDEISQLGHVSAVLIDRDYLQIYDNLIEMRSVENGVSLHRNYFYNVWKTFSTSPFCTAVVFSDVNSEITGVTLKIGDTSVAGSTITVAGPQVQGTYTNVPLTAKVVGGGFRSKEIRWIAQWTGTGVKPEYYLSNTGQLNVGYVSTTTAKLKVIATSVVNSDKKAEVTINLSQSVAPTA